MFSKNIHMSVDVIPILLQFLYSYEFIHRHTSVRMYKCIRLFMIGLIEKHTLRMSIKLKIGMFFKSILSNGGYNLAQYGRIISILMLTDEAESVLMLCFLAEKWNGRGRKPTEIPRRF